MPLSFRARWLFKHIAPSHFDQDGHIQDWTVEEALSCRVERIAEFVIRNNPHLALDANFGSLPKQIAHPVIPFDIENLYQPELDYCIQAMVATPNITAETLINRIHDRFHSIPPIAAEKIAHHAVSIRQQDHTIGLPLFARADGIT